MRQEPNPLEDLAYTTARGRRYTYWTENRLAYDLIRDTLIWKFQLYRGDTKFPRTQLMSLGEAIEYNRLEALKFAARLDCDKNTRLWEWRLIDKDKYYNLRRVRMDTWISTGISKDENAMRKAINQFNKSEEWK
jgi:hypothetical protein